MQTKLNYFTVTFVAALLLAGSACGASDGPEQAARTRGTLPPEGATILQRGFNQLVNSSDAAVIAVVGAETTPYRWNSHDGLEWPGAEGTGGAPPIQFRDVSLVVEKVIFGSAKLSPVAGQPLALRTVHSGRPDGEAHVVEGGNAIFEGQLDGDLAIGSRVLLLLAKVDNFPTEGGRVGATMINGSWQGNWRIEGDRAVSAEEGRSVPLAALLARMNRERSEGQHPERDERSVVNPLG